MQSVCKPANEARLLKKHAEQDEDFSMPKHTITLQLTKQQAQDILDDLQEIGSAFDEVPTSVDVLIEKLDQALMSDGSGVYVGESGE
jgi:hypothetical protein